MKRRAALALLTTVSPMALLIGSPADAADMAIKARPAPPPPPAYSWTGCYVGAHVGWGWGQNRFTDGTFSTGGDSNGASSSSNGSLNSSGALFGGQLGCNYQFAGWSPWAGSNWVFGIQGDFAGTDFNGKGQDPNDPTDNEIISLKSDWLASITARLGVTAFNNQALFYVKGGAAWIHNKWDLSQADLFFGGSSLFQETNPGWTIGGGAEWTLWSPNWTAFVEYNFYDFNHGSTLTVNDCIEGPDSHCFFTRGRQTINAVKVGVNYKFGFGP